jgi:hydroxyacylglutathione hydrolase
LVVDGPSALEQATLFLARQGIDHVAGMLAGGFEAWRNAGMPVEPSGTITARELAESRDVYAVLDVREISEFESGHIEGATNVYVGHLEDRLADLPPEFGKASRIAVTCSVGHRASLAVSILKRHGYARVYNLLGGMTAWQQLDLPMVRESEQHAA